MGTRSRMPSKLQKEEGNRGQTIKTLSAGPRGGKGWSSPGSSVVSGALRFGKSVEGDIHSCPLDFSGRFGFSRKYGEDNTMAAHQCQPQIGAARKFPARSRCRLLCYCDAENFFD